MNIGIEAINAYVGQASLDVRLLFQERGLDLKRFDNLLMEKKSVALPCEDPVTNGVNAAKPLIEKMDPKERDKIELLITSTESGLDFGKSLSTYIHKYLGLNRECRLFEVKQACYGGTAALQMAFNTIASNASPNAKALIVSTDSARSQTKMTFAEPSQGMGAVAMVISQEPDILKVDFGSNGYYGFEVMDTCRPRPEIETGNIDLSLMTYMDCLENSFRNYAKKVANVDFQNSFDYLVYHTPYSGMVRSAHRNLLRLLKKLPPDKLEEDFQRRVKPSLNICSRVGNVYSAALYMALCGLLEYGEINSPKKVGFYSYGSGCCSEFYSGTLTPNSQQKIKQMNIDAALKNRYELNIKEYDRLLDLNMKLIFGIENALLDTSDYADLYNKTMKGKGLLVLKQIKDYQRDYVWS